jgi:hypothetical protein
MIAESRLAFRKLMARVGNAVLEAEPLVIEIRNPVAPDPPSEERSSALVELRLAEYSLLDRR